MFIGICGKSGSGKSTLAANIIDAYKNAIHCDIDKIGHKALADVFVKEELINCFGDKIITNNQVDRKILGNIVFSSKEKMDKLTDITWNYMQKEIDKFIETNDNKLIILDWILLPKSKYFDKCKLKILLDIPYETRKKRVITRDRISEDSFKLRDNASITFNQKEFNLVFKDNEKIDIERIVNSL